MFKIKKFILASVIFASCLYVSNMVANYVFVQDTSTDATGEVEVKDRSYEVNNIVLTAGYSDTSCSVQDFDRNDISSNKEGIKNFFVEDENVTDDYGNHFVQLKKYYVNMSQNDAGIITYKLSHTKVDNKYFVCPYFLDKDGNEIAYAYYGKYKGNVNDNKLCSISGVTPSYLKTIDAYRNYARANGDEYHQTDWCAVFTAQIMYMCTYKTTDIPYSTYRNCESETGEGTQFLGIEDLVGNGYEFVDGIVFKTDGSSTLSGSSISYANKISDYASSITSNTTTLTGAIGANGEYISKMYYSDGKPALSIFPKELSGNFSTYYCDAFYFSSRAQNNVIYWGSQGSFASGGLFSLGCDCSWSYVSSIVGSRLHAKTLNLES